MSKQNWLTAAELQEEFGFSRWKIYKLLHEECPTYRIGSNLLVKREDFEQWLEAQRCEPVGKGGAADE